MAGAGGGGGGGGAAAAGQQQAPAAAGAVGPAEFAAAAAEADPERRRDVIARFWERLTPEQREVLSGLLRMPTSAPDTEIGMNLPKPKRKAIVKILVGFIDQMDFDDDRYRRGSMRSPEYEAILKALYALVCDETVTRAALAAAVAARDAAHTAHAAAANAEEGQLDVPACARLLAASEVAQEALTGARTDAEDAQHEAMKCLGEMIKARQASADSLETRLEALRAQRVKNANKIPGMNKKMQDFIRDVKIPSYMALLSTIAKRDNPGDEHSDWVPKTRSDSFKLERVLDELDGKNMGQPSDLGSAKQFYIEAIMAQPDLAELTKEQIDSEYWYLSGVCRHEGAGGGGRRCATPLGADGTCKDHPDFENFGNLLK